MQQADARGHFFASFLRRRFAPLAVCHHSLGNLDALRAVRESMANARVLLVTVLCAGALALAAGTEPGAPPWTPRPEIERGPMAAKRLRTPSRDPAEHATSPSVPGKCCEPHALLSDDDSLGDAARDLSFKGGAAGSAGAGAGEGARGHAAAGMNESSTEAAAYEEEALSCSGAEQDPLFEFITNGVLLNAIGAFGVLGNVVSMVILSRPQMRSSINYLLVGLAVSDTMLIITSVLLFGLPAVYTYTGALFTYQFKVYSHLVPVVYPLALISQTVSVYLTLTVTLERFVAVCHPLRARSLCTYGRARLYVLVIIALSALYNLPRFWEVETYAHWDSERNTTLLVVLPTELRRNHLYVTVYINWLYMALLYFLPFTVLAVLNTAIYRQVRRASKELQLSRLQKEEISLATTLLCIVVIFFLCNLLALVNNIMEVFYCSIMDQLVKTSNLLITINSSVNFIIYVIFGEKFKRLFLKLFCHIWAADRESPNGAKHNSLVSNGNGLSFTYLPASKEETTISSLD